MPVTISEKAATEFIALLGREGKSGAALRLWVAGLGCSGFRYGMGIEDKEPEKGDSIFDSHGVRIMVDEDSMKHMDGSRVDFIDDPDNGGFSVDNPNPAPVMDCDCGAGGCGEPAAGDQSRENSG